MGTELKITPPEGYEIDRENSTLELIKFKKIGKWLPKSWEEARKVSKSTRLWFIGGSSDILYTTRDWTLNIGDENLFHTKKQAEAMLAFIQLIWLRDIYNDGWKPNWRDGSERKYCIRICKDNPLVLALETTVTSLNFKSYELAEEFLHNFRDLIEKAKMYI